MDRNQFILVGAVLAFVGCISLILPWESVNYIEFYFNEYVSINGIDLLDYFLNYEINSGYIEIDFGYMAPLVICILFIAIGARYLIMQYIGRDENHFVPVLIMGGAIVGLSIYMLWWSGVWEPDYYDVEYHVSSGEILAIIMAIVSIVIAYILDYPEMLSFVPFDDSPDYSERTPRTAPAPVTFANAPVMTCPNCRRGLTQKDIEGTTTCRYCGVSLGTDSEESTEKKS